MILASLFLVETEPRISDIIFDWVNSNAALLSAQRLKNLQKDYPEQVHGRLADFVQRIPSLAKVARWQKVSQPSTARDSHKFPAIVRATQPTLKNPPNLLLRLRTAMAVGVKADALSVVLGKKRPVTIRYVADSLSYTTVGVRNAMMDLVSAGFVGVTPGQPASYIAGDAMGIISWIAENSKLGALASVVCIRNRLRQLGK
ncbi:MAG: hypothetical protein M3Y64_08490 [Gemmatimonadota bacterium]|nr:hypothetical protein [Gemmatimonadota bacterium]